MNEIARSISETLSALIEKMAVSPELFVKKPGVDFTRKRKLSFRSVVQLLISMGGNSVYKELLEAQGYAVNTATTPAFVQQRDKILPCAFDFLLREFTGSYSATKKHRGYRLLAADGSDLHVPTNPHDSDTFFQNRPDEKGYNLLHLNAVYDLCSRLYVDSLLQPGKQRNENSALTAMVDRSGIKDRAILLADRNYESYNTFAHIDKKGWNYLIRVKDLGSSGILSALPLPDSDEFDVCMRRLLTRAHTKEVKAHPDIYRFLPANTTFDFLNLTTSKFFTMDFRVVRFKIAKNSYETVITNLDQTEFSPADLKALYKLRWGIETSFRELKYAVGLVNFHSKKRDHIAQEVFARIILYNFSEMITAHAVISQAKTHYDYQVNFTVAIHICRQSLRACFWNHASPPNVIALICKNILPIRPNRRDKRKIRYHSAVSFLYRVA